MINLCKVILILAWLAAADLAQLQGYYIVAIGMVAWIVVVAVIKISAAALEGMAKALEEKSQKDNKEGP